VPAPGRGEAALSSPSFVLVFSGGDYFTVGYNTRKVMKKIVSGTVSVFLLSSEFGLREFLHGFRYAA